MKSIQEVVQQYFGYQKFLKRKATELSKQDKQKTGEIARISTEIDFLYTEIHTLSRRKQHYPRIWRPM